MNRSERRAAAARVKAASSSAPADIAELMAQANEAYRARRLAQAEIICKQVLSRTPAHATCLNLLGVVYQTAGRHRPAVKLFAKAIAVDEDVLIAGCGTGQHPFSNAQYSPQARILAVDISRTALAYARRKTREAGLHNIEYAQADILKLGTIGRTFDRIETVGVLHHLAEPKAGWRVLLSLLAPNGTMRVGLYSAAARRAVVEARALIAERGYSATADDIRALRQTVIRGQSTNTLLKIADFYTMSGCRDLLFNVMEHRFTIPEIAAFLNQHALLFHGFELEPAIIEQFQERYPGGEALTNLDNWHEFETANPDTFWHMYAFTVSRNE